MTLESLASQIKTCVKCPLWESRQNAVPGEGNPKAKLFFVGEGPGREEDKTGRPFVGRAGNFLDEMLRLINLKREEIFITNVVKCHPEKNRNPSLFEIKTCTQNYLFNQMQLINPKIIVLLGLNPLHVFFPEVKTLKNTHGQILVRGDIIFFALYHPALVLHRPDLRDVLKIDFLKLGKAIKEIIR